MSSLHAKKTLPTSCGGEQSHDMWRWPGVSCSRSTLERLSNFWVTWQQPPSNDSLVWALGGFQHHPKPPDANKSRLGFEWVGKLTQQWGSIALGGGGGVTTVVFCEGGNRKDQSIVYSWHPEGTHVVHQTCCIIHGRLCAAPCLPKKSRLFLREEWKEAGRDLLSRNGVGRQHRGTVIRDTHSPNRHTPLSCAFLLNFLWLSHNSLLLDILIYSFVCFLALCDTRKKIHKIIDKLD